MSKQNEELLKKYNQGIKIDIACGSNKQDGFVGIDIQSLKGVDIIHDLETFPYPLPDKCANFAIASHYVEHINPAKFGVVKFMNEIWRLLKDGGRFAICCPYAGSPGDYQDPTHVSHWTEATFFYFDPIHQSKLYQFYKPKPWKIINNFWNQSGNLEVLLEKRLEDKSYDK